jgi:AcrR family transcriptional regulator
VAGRREQLRTELLASVREAARDNLRQDGPAGLSLRAVARDVGISPAGLYRYYDGRDALLTMLITEGYGDLADHLFLAQGAADLVADSDRHRHVPHAVDREADVGDRVRATWRTYRSWALEHPNEFHLLFGQPVEGYAAPAGGETVAANARMSRALVTPMLEAHVAGRLPVPALADPPAGALRLAGAIADVAPVPVSPAFAAMSLSWWSWLHGAVALELNGQFLWMEPEGATDELFEATMAMAMRDLRPAP